MCRHCVRLVEKSACAIQFEMSLRRVPDASTEPTSLTSRFYHVLQAGMHAKAPSGVQSSLQGNELEKVVNEYISKNLNKFKVGYPNPNPRPGDRVLERDSGRLGTVIEGGRWWGAIWHPAIQYDDDLEYDNTSHNSLHFIIVLPGADLSDIPW